MKLSGADTGMVRALVISSAANIFYHESMHHGAPTRGSAVPRVVQNTKRGLPCTRVHVVSNYGFLDRYSTIGLF